MNSKLRTPLFVALAVTGLLTFFGEARAAAFTVTVYEKNGTIITDIPSTISIQLLDCNQNPIAGLTPTYTNGIITFSCTAGHLGGVTDKSITIVIVRGNTTRSIPGLLGSGVRNQVLSVTIGPRT